MSNENKTYLATYAEAARRIRFWQRELGRMGARLVVVREISRYANNGRHVSPLCAAPDAYMDAVGC